MGCAVWSSKGRYKMIMDFVFQSLILYTVVYRFEVKGFKKWRVVTSILQWTKQDKARVWTQRRHGDEMEGQS